MKKLIYFLLFSTAAFSQNYQYSLEEVPTKTPVPEVPSGVNNQLEEIEYFKAYLLPLAQKATLQAALDKYGSVRLEKGDYTIPGEIVLHSNQSLYGHNSLTLFGGIKIAAGSTNVHLEDFEASRLTFEAGAPITNCVIKTIKNATIDAIGAKLENNLFLNILSRVNFDFSSGGYYRNNKLIKMQSGSISPILVLKGNSATPSYGNVHLWTNLLTPWGDAAILDNLQSSTFVGIDAEMWNAKNESVGLKAMFYARNMGDVKLTDVGGSTYASVQTPGFDIQANNVSILHNGIGSSAVSLISPNADVVDVGSFEDFIRSPGTVTGFKLKAHKDYKENEQDILYNGTLQNTAITNPAIIANTTKVILGTQRAPWPRPNWEKLPDPLGANWKADRAGKPDSKTYIQNLINTNKIAELPEGVYYIGSTITIGSNNEGIIGSGTGKTVIVGLTDDFPLITMTSAKGGYNYVLSNLTLQGGSIGQFFPENFAGVSFVNLKYVVFRDQKIGIHLYKMGGTDNCFYNNISFVNCGTGFFQEPKPITDNVDMGGYVDKVVFYQGQYINCGTAVSVHAARANNLNLWVNSKFDGNGTAVSLGNNNYPIMANCDFTNTYGENIIKGGDLSLYNCNFYSNKVTQSSMKMYYTYVEGCNFLDNVPYNTQNIYQPSFTIIVNSTVKGDVLPIRSSSDWGKDTGVYMNSTLNSNPTLSKILVNLKDRVPTVIIDGAANPYPQLLVTH